MFTKKNEIFVVSQPKKLILSIILGIFICFDYIKINLVLNVSLGWETANRKIGGKKKWKNYLP